MSHLGFIAASYVVTVLVLVVLTAWIVADGRAQRRRLAEFEARGIRRRSAPSAKQVRSTANEATSHERA